jgi:hypothetical protein
MREVTTYCRMVIDVSEEHAVSVLWWKNKPRVKNGPCYYTKLLIHYHQILYYTIHISVITIVYISHGFNPFFQASG